MPALRNFIKRLGPLEESICSRCCQIIRPVSQGGATLQSAQEEHRCAGFSLNTFKRGDSVLTQEHSGQ